MAIIEAIQTVFLEADSGTSIHFQSIPTDYAHLQLRCSMKSLNTNIYNTGAEMRFGDTNGIDSAGNYSSHRLEGDDNEDIAFGSSSNDAAQVYPLCNSRPANHAAEYGIFVVDIFDYRSTVKNVTWKAIGGAVTSRDQTYRDSGVVSAMMGLWDKPTLSNPMTQFYISNNNLARGSMFTLYGIKGT